jgi:hypothetical protein
VQLPAGGVLDDSAAVWGDPSAEDISPLNVAARGAPRPAQAPGTHLLGPLSCPVGCSQSNLGDGLDKGEVLRAGPGSEFRPTFECDSDRNPWYLIGRPLPTTATREMPQSVSIRSPKLPFQWQVSW